MTSIYTLHDPDGELRYVGKTILPIEARLGLHISNAKRARSRSYCASWIRSLLRDGETPRVKLVEMVIGDRWAEVERQWIAHYRGQGCRLTNLSDGGEGAPGYRHTPEELVKMSAAMTGKRHTDETRAKMSAAAKGRPARVRGPHSDATKARIRERAQRRDNTRLREATISRRIVDPVVIVEEREYERSESWRTAISLAKRGSGHHRAKLDEDAVVQIKALLLDREMTHKEIAAMFGVSREAIGLIQRNKRWGHVPWPCEVTS